MNVALWGGQAALAMLPRLGRYSWHAHRPWRVSRWVECGGGWVAWELHTAPCPHCPDCDGAGGWWTGGGPYGEDPEEQLCYRCAEPLLALQLPTWLDRAIPGSPTRFRYSDNDEPPF
ncbi:hypothetical protein [Nocardia brasiliensis]|uniref:hypothetical protein n=1 Tax=Nocardia brasiliensis TaxID=37326 RepID=UPI002459098B|nr:hypothetical protein [Nocardia brasiliensis]